MSQNITEAKLSSFAKAVSKAAHEHLGANGVISIAVGLDRDTYLQNRMEMMRTGVMNLTDIADSKLAYFGGFVTVVGADHWAEFDKMLKRRL
ncbi:MAG TPA: hypothetical protein VKB96_05925 [Gammaproteobacteria bacterium]|nr:hypothetical protein [Gammaproteobacteria bacterium]